MKRLLSPPRVLLVVLLGAALSSGCGKSRSLSPVSGTVTVDGAPVTSGQVTYMPAEKDEENKDLSTGPIDSSGNYKIFTGGKAGVPPGKYKVTVTPSMVPSGGTSLPKTPFNQRFSNARDTPLTVTVPTGPYDLKLTK